MLRIRRGSQGTANAHLILTGPNAGSVWYSLDVDPGIGSMSGVDSLSCVEIIGGDPDDLHRAAEILRAKAWWASSCHWGSLRMRTDADAVDALARADGRQHGED